MKFKNYDKAAKAIKAKIGGFVPEVALVLGSGLGFLGDECENAITVPYSEVPRMKSSTAPGHKGQFVFGTLAGKRVAVMQGRIHTYEGYSFEAVTMGVRILNMLGAKTLIVTNACGGVNLNYKVGDIMVIADHINLTGNTPLTGVNIPEFGTRFPDLTKTYTPALRELAHKSAKTLGQTLQEGVYMMFTGPQYETPAEIRASRVLGADTVGMSTVPEAVAARHAGMDILGFSLICNMAAGVLDQPLTEQEVLDEAAAAREKFSALILKCLEDM
jgi:purine-nucleoside phosphorylase